MSTNPSCDIKKDLLASQAHIRTKPSLIPHNLVVVVSWHVIRELFHISWSGGISVVLTVILQHNALPWEQAKLPWELPAYISDLAQELEVTTVWIANSGLTEGVTTKPMGLDLEPLARGSQRWRSQKRTFHPQVGLHPRCNGQTR